jgi:hypothetical protein
VSATFVGSVTLAAALPSLSAQLALAFELLDGLGLAFQAEFVAEAQASLDAQIEVGVELGVTPPGVALDLMIAGALDAVANLQVTPPALQLDAQLEANAAVVADLQAKLAALLSLLVPVKAALDAYLELRGLLLAAGVRVYRASGPIESVLGEVDALAQSGHPGAVPPGTHVKAVIFLVDTSNVPASAAFDVTFAAGA